MKNKYNCKNCGKEYYSYNKNSKYCSKKCTAEGKKLKERIKGLCDYCGETLYCGNHIRRNNIEGLVVCNNCTSRYRNYGRLYKIKIDLSPEQKKINKEIRRQKSIKRLRERDALLKERRSWIKTLTPLELLELVRENEYDK